MDTISGWPGEPVTLPGGARVFVRHAPAAPAASPGAPPVVEIHGLGGSSTNWTTLMRELRDEFEQWAPDLPGYGESPPASGHTIDDYVGVVEAFLERFDRPVHLVGNSMGGMICVLVAAGRPDLVASLSLFSPAMPGYRLPSAAWMTAVLALPRVGERMLAKTNGVLDDAQVARLAAILYADVTAVDQAELDFAVEQRRRWMAQPHADAVLLASLRSIVGRYALPQRRSVWAAARRILCPALVVVSGKDALIGSAALNRWRRTLPRARVVRLPASGHVPMMEHPGTAADLVRTFIHDASTIRPGPGHQVREWRDA